MKNWVYINIPNWQQYQQDLQRYSLKLINNNHCVIQNSVDLKDFANECTNFFKYIIKTFGMITYASMFVMHEQTTKVALSENCVHSDSGNQFRLNCPILNPTSIVTKYFTVTDPTYQPHRIYHVPPKNGHVEIYDIAKCQEIDQVCVDAPIIFNARTPHGLFINGNQWPRIMISFNFRDESMLKEYFNSAVELVSN
jgi:hypothetical protein